MSAAAQPRRAATRRPARPKVALAPMLPRRGSDDELGAVDHRFLLSALPDGWRCLALLDDRVRIRSRSGHDLAAAVPSIAGALGRLRPRQGVTIVDGILILPPSAECPWPALADVPTLEVLDVLCVAGRDVTARTMRERQEILRALPWPRDAALRVAPAWQGDARASFAQLQTSGSRTHAALLARRSASPYAPACRARDWIAFGEHARAEMLLCGIAAGGALVLGMPLPHGVAFAGLTWPTRRWSTLAQRCCAGPPLFPTEGMWPSLGAVTWARPDLWLAVEPDVRPASGRGGPRWRLLRVQEDLSRPPVASAGAPGAGRDQAPDAS